MKFINTILKNCFIIEPKIIKDNRGFFCENYSKFQINKAIGLNINFIQDNLSKSNYGVVRGLHIQLPPFSQSKLINVYYGKILDVVVDVRKDSLTYGKHISVELSSDNNKQLFIPKGFLHGYSVLSEFALVGYKCDILYNKAFEKSIFYLDSNLNIDWKISLNKVIISQKDKMGDCFKNLDPININ